MTSTAITNLGGPDRPRPLISTAGWVWIALCGVLFALMHWTILHQMYRVSSDPNWSHILIVPLISLYFIFQHKHRLQAAPWRVCWWALPIVFLGLFSYLWWIYPGRNDMFRGYSMILTLFGGVLFLFGTSAMRVLWFPIAYLAFAVKISDAIWERIAERLQDIAAAGSTLTLQAFAVFMDFQIDSSGNTIYISFFKNGSWQSHPMNIAEACAGLRMLMAFVALGVALAFLWDRAWWQRLIMISMAVPIAVAVNIGRVTTLGLLHLIDPSYAKGDFHLFIGMLMLIPAAGLFMLLGWVLDKIIIVDENNTSDRPTIAAPPPPAPAEPTDPARVRGLVVRGVVMGSLLSLLAGLSYAMMFNSFSGAKLIDSLPRGASVALMVLGLLLLAATAVMLLRVAPGRLTAGCRTFAVAVVVGVLAVAAAGQYSVVSWQKAVLVKKPVALRHPLPLLSQQLGRWTFIRDDELSAEVVDELGTTDYLSRYYRDNSVAEGEPGSMVRLHVAYYTGLVDTVPHVPDRCFVAGGVKHGGLFDQVLHLDPDVIQDAESGRGFDAYTANPNLDDPLAPGSIGTEVHLPERDIDAKRFTYRVPNNNADQHVMYFFAVNGKFLASPNAVRLQGFDIRDTHSYYCKIEVQVIGEPDPERFAEKAQDLLNDFLPEIMACLPDWQEVRDGQWPIDPENNPALNQP